MFNLLPLHVLPYLECPILVADLVLAPLQIQILLNQKIILRELAEHVVITYLHEYLLPT